MTLPRTMYLPCRSLESPYPIHHCTCVLRDTAYMHLGLEYPDTLQDHKESEPNFLQDKHCPRDITKMSLMWGSQCRWDNNTPMDNDA